MLSKEKAKLVKKERENLYKDIKEKYEISVNPIKRPKRIVICNWIFLVLAIFDTLMEISMFFSGIKAIKIIFLVAVVVTLLFGIINLIYDKQYKFTYRISQGKVRTDCLNALSEIAKNIGLEKEESVKLAMYLYTRMGKPKYISLIISIISLVLTAVAVYVLPGYDQTKGGLIVLVLLVIANSIVSWLANYFSKQLREMSYIDYYLVNPFSDMFDEIDIKLIER